MAKKKAPADKSTPATFRLSKADIAMIEALAARWGPVQKLSQAAVVRESIRRIYEAEFGKRKP